MSNHKPPELPSRDLREQETVIPDSADNAAALAAGSRQVLPAAGRNEATQAAPVAPAASAATRATRARDEPRPGLRIGKYQLLGELGRGGMGVVFLARDETLGRSVAIKFLSVDSPSMAARFMNEARLTARCEHKNIVVLYDVAEHDGRPYMVLEYLEGKALDEMLQAASTDAASTEAASNAASNAGGAHRTEDAVAQAVGLMLPVVRALECAHSMGIIHRDLKPANVMVTYSGAVKVLDFGIAKALDGTDGRAAPATRGVGTAPYMAPEQLFGQIIDARVDIWAVGIMLHMLAVGEHPLAPAPAARLQQIAALYAPMPRALEHHPQLGRLAGIIDSCLEPQADRRPSATALLDALERLQASLPADGASAPRVPPEKQPAEKLLAEKQRADRRDRSQIGPYTIRERLGKGGMAVVYRAHQAAIDRDVAIKVMNRSLAGDPEAMARFTREARLVARLEHPHIVPIHDFDAGHDPPYLVTRYLSGGTLRTLTRERTLALSEIADIVSQVCSALDYAHRQGVVHRDIKPSNILLDDDMRAFVGDFGIARMVGSATDNPLTAAGAAVGTAEYMAPEQARGLTTVDARADVYALGIIAFQLLTGSLPFTGNYLDVLMQQAQQPAPHLRTRAAEAPEALESVIARALSKAPDERFPSAAEFDLAFQSAVVVHQSGAGGRERYRRMSPSGGGADTSVNSQATPDAQNKQVIALHMDAGAHADMVAVQRSADAARRALQALFGAALTIIRERGGVLAEYTHDTLTAVWGAGARHENDAERALHSALDLLTDARERAEAVLGDSQDAPDPDSPTNITEDFKADMTEADMTEVIGDKEFEADVTEVSGAGAQRAADVGVDIGVHAGVALLSATEYADHVQVSGMAIRECRRLTRQAGGAVVISQPVHNLVRGLFTMQPERPLQHRGRPGEIPVYRVLAARPAGFRVGTRGIEGVDNAMIGRDAELKTLTNTYLETVEEGEQQLITIVGGAGLGKSRLLDEFCNWLEWRTELVSMMPARATPEMTHRPYALMREIVATSNGILDTDPPEVIERKLEEGVALVAGPHPETAHLLGHLVGYDLDHSPYVAPLLDDPRQLNVRARLLFRRQIQRACRQQPIIVIYEDLQHADEATLDMITEVAREEPDIPLFTVCLTRPEFFERRPHWGNGLDNHLRVELRPLDRRESRTLVRSILHKLPDVPTELRDLLVARSEGNPFFMEELVRMLIEDRIIHPQSDGPWRLEEARLAHLQVPSTLRGLVQAKLDSLLPSERLVVQRAAVLGRVFHDQALVALDDADDTRVADLPAVLDRLRGLGLIAAREVSSLPDSDEYLFASSLTREVVLETLLERQRLLYNRIAAEWLIATSGERAEEYLGLIAEYFEQAGEHLVAVAYLKLAGRKALELCSYREARALFARALDLQPRASVLSQVRLGLAEASFHLGEFQEARSQAEAVLFEADPHKNVSVVVRARCQLAEVASGSGLWAEACEHLERAQPMARASAEPDLLLLVLTELGRLCWRLGDCDRARALAEEGMPLARDLGASTLELRNLNTIAVVAIFCGDLERARTLWTEGLARAQELGNRERAAVIILGLGEVFRRQGKLQPAHERCRQAEAMLRELEQQYYLVLTLACLVLTENALGRESHARRALTEILGLSRSLATPNVKLKSVVAAGHFLALTGQRRRGLGLIGLVGRHPAASAFDHQDIDWVLDHLGLDPTSPEVAEAMAAGHALDLDRVMVELTAEYS